MIIPSNENARIAVPTPKSVITPAVLGGALVNDWNTAYLARIGTPEDLKIVLYDSTGLDIAWGSLSSIPAGISSGGVSALTSLFFYFTIDKSLFTSSGMYRFVLAYTPGGADAPEYDYGVTEFQWGGIADDIQKVRKYILNKSTSDFSSPTAPVLSVMDDDGVTPFLHRAVRNADGSSVSQKQIMDMDAATP